MEPLWLGITVTSLGSAVRSVASKAVEPFEDLLEAAQNLTGNLERSQDSSPELALSKNPHFQLLMESLRGQSQFGNVAKIDLHDIRDRADALQLELEEIIAQTLQEFGLDLQGEYHLEFSRQDGSLTLNGDNYRHTEIEKALADEPKVAAEIRRLSALRSLLSAAERNPAFADAYELNPFQAVEEYAALFDSNQEVFLSGSSLMVQLRFE